ncbi:MAG: hypothetical protein ACXV5Q_01815 [Frankiaceae bacterium]
MGDDDSSLVRDPAATARMIVATPNGVAIVGPATHVLVGEDVVALARDGATVWAAGRAGEVWRCNGLGGDDPTAVRVGTVEGGATCLLPFGPGVLAGSAGAHLWLLADDGNPQGRATLVDAFEHAEDRYDWFTPWGAPPDVRSLAQGRDVVLVNVHVGGILRATALSGPWKASIDIHADVHQVISSGRGDGAALAATALGLAVSPDDGSTWRLVDDGLPATYARAVASCEDAVLLSASSGPGAEQSRLYRRSLADEASFTPCHEGLPSAFEGNLDTFRLDGSGRHAGLVTARGDVYASSDSGGSWQRAATGIRRPRALLIL